MSDIWTGIEFEMAAFDRLNAKVLEQAERLVSAARIAGFPPKSAECGFRPTMRLLWDDGRTEVEVFEEVYELYFLPASDEDGEFSVWEFETNVQGNLERLTTEIRKAVFKES